MGDKVRGQCWLKSSLRHLYIFEALRPHNMLWMATFEFDTCLRYFFQVLIFFESHNVYIAALCFHIYLPKIISCN